MTKFNECQLYQKFYLHFRLLYALTIMDLISTLNVFLSLTKGESRDLVPFHAHKTLKKKGGLDKLT